jgi:hypothetical protein
VAASSFVRDGPVSWGTAASLLDAPLVAEGACGCMGTLAIAITGGLRMPDLLDSIRRELRARLDELLPLVREFERLEDAHRALADGPAIRPKRGGGSKGAEARPGGAAQAGSRRRSTLATEREANRQKILGLIGERPGITKGELKDAAGMSGAGVAQNLRRMLDRGEVHEEALPGGATSYRIGDSQTEPTETSRKVRQSRR